MLAAHLIYAAWEPLPNQQHHSTGQANTQIFTGPRYEELGGFNKTRQMAGLWHRAKSSNQEQALMELGPVLLPFQNMKKSIDLEAPLKKKKKKSKLKFLQTF